MKSLAAFALALSHAAAAAAIVYERIPTDEAMIGKARAIVFGEILSSRPVGTDGLFTDFVLRVEETLKGAVPAMSITVRQPGGRTADGLFSDIAGLPRFVPGDRVLLFLEPAVDVRRPVEVRRSAGVRRTADTWQPVDAWRPVDLGLGMFFETVVEGRTLLLREPAVEIGSLSEEAAGDEAEDHSHHHLHPRSAGAFRRWIADRAAGRKRPADYFEPTPDPGSGPVRVRQRFEVDVEEDGQCAGLVYRWPASLLPVRMTLETHTAPPRGIHGKSSGDGAEEVLDAMASWNRAPGTAYRLLALRTGRQKTVGDAEFRDQVNSIRFSDPANDLDRTAALAAARRWSECQTTKDQVTGEIRTVAVILESDVLFRNGLGPNWRLLGYPDAALERLLGHELGHVLGLGHSRHKQALMYAAVNRDGSRSVLEPDDQRGIRFLYPASSSTMEGAAAEVSLALSRPPGKEVRFDISYGGPEDTATGASDPAAGDYDNDAVTQVTFSPTDNSRTIMVPITDDGENEGPETFTVTFAPAAALPAGAEGTFVRKVTIADDDSSPVLDDIEDFSVTAGGAVDITARATDDDNDPITYAWTRKPGENTPAIPGGTALNRARLTFTATTAGTYTMTVTASDNQGNSDTERVVITVLAVSQGNSSPVLQPIADRTVRPGRTVDITAQASDADNDPITYAWTRRSDENAPAIPGGTALNQARLVFATTTAGTYTMAVTASDDDGNSDTEQVVVTVEAAVGVTLSTSALTVEEGGSGAYDVKLATRPSSPVTVTVTVAGATGEMTVSGSPLTFTPGNYGTAQTVTVAAGADEDTVNDTATLTHTAASNDRNYGSLLRIGVVDVTVTDTTPALPASTPTLQLLTDPATVTEGTDIRLTVTSDKARTGDLPVRLMLTDRGASGFFALVDIEVSLIDPSSVESLWPLTLLLDAAFGATSSKTGTVLIPTAVDQSVEGPETYRITLDSGTGYVFGADRTADGTLNDGMLKTVSVPGALSVAESAGSAAVRVTASAAPGESVTFAVTYGGSATGASSPGSGDDYDNDAVTQVVFSSTDTAKDIAIPIRDDGLDENSETIEVTIALAPGSTLPAGFELGVATTTVTITDDDESPVLAELAARSVAVGQVVDITAAATDGDNDPITYAWTRKTGENTPAIPQDTELNQARLTFTTTVPGTYTMTVTASDGNGNSDTEEVVVTVRPADPVDDGSDGGGDGPPGDPGGNDGGSDGGGPGGNDGSNGGGSGPPGGPGGNGAPPGGTGGSNGGPAGGGDGSGGSDGDSGAGGDGSGGGGAPPGGTGGGNGGPAGGGNGSGGSDGGSGAGGSGADGAGGNDDDDDDDRGGPGGNDDDSGDGDGSGATGEAVRASFTLDAPCADGLCRARTAVPVSFEDRSSGAVTSRNWSLGDGATSRSRSLEHAWSVPGFYTVSLTVSGQGPSSTVSRKVLVEAADPVGACAANGETLCLQDSRFSVTMDWWTEDGEGGRRGAGKVVHEGTNDSGLFWFFSAVNWELLVKVLDGCSVNGRMWVYGASATTLGYSLKVTDTVTGAVQEYRNEPGRQAEAFTDSAAFPGSCTDSAAAAAAADASALPLVAEPLPEPPSEPPAAHHLAVATVSVAAPAEEDGCTDTATAMCLQKGRYEVTVTWSNLDGMSGSGRTAGPRTDDSGLFHFFSPANWEILVKVLDGCSFNDHHWVFAASATDVGFDLRVRDTATGRTRQYTKQPGKPARALVDVSAFPQACRQP